MDSVKCCHSANEERTFRNFVQLKALDCTQSQHRAEEEDKARRMGREQMKLTWNWAPTTAAAAHQFHWAIPENRGVQKMLKKWKFSFFHRK